MDTSEKDKKKNDGSLEDWLQKNHFRVWLGYQPDYTGLRTWLTLLEWMCEEHPDLLKEWRGEE